MPNMPVYSLEPPRQANLKLRLDGVTEDFIDEDMYASSGASPVEERPNKPKSPAGGFTSFFGWNAAKTQNGADSPTTTFSEKSASPASPGYPKQQNSIPIKIKPTGLDIPVANNFSQSSYFNVPGTPLLSSSPQMNAHVEELERELREVSSELAASIQREMELEDEVERWKADSSTVVSDNRRTSDYYSDSGASSVRYPMGDSESKLEELDMLRRKAEQERATLKVRMAERLQDELRRRRDLEEQVQLLEDKVSGQSRTGSVALAPNVKDPRVKELEGSLQDAQRRLAEERQVKENFEDLLTALREELEKHRNERDNLRDEVVPQLRARLEGLETEAADTQTLIYESTRMQQEIHTLRSENSTLVNARKMQLETAQQQNRFQPIAEEAEAPAVQAPRVGLSRSNSLARSSAFNGTKKLSLARSGSLSRANTVKERSGGESPRDVSPIAGNPVKELEEQRDALHKALKHLLQRQELQQREFQARIKELEIERDNALNLTPRRTTFRKEVAHLREEVNSLRRRADDALEQKWQCEKGLGGLRMDLDRAQQETSSLRDLLQEHDITIPEIRLDNQPISLDRAYKELRTTHALSLAQIKQMDSNDSLGEAGVEAERTLDLLKRSISDAEVEREAAQNEAEQYRQQARDLQRSEIEHLGKEQKLSSELYAAATRMDELSNRIQLQLQSNKNLRNRLADAISRGETEQKRSTEKIIELERRLKSAEDKVMIAQQSSDEAITRHEEEVEIIKESHNTHLRRVKSGLLSPVAFSPKMPSSPIFATRPPRLSQTSSGPGMSMAEATRTELLEKRVGELEKALSDADREMEEVVGRMNMAQMEVADLQFER
jgi:predicted  nucleic acid-binding Zn-ribbon protein